MDITSEITPQPERTEEYAFVRPDGHVATITLWPERGDTSTERSDGWVFDFPRLKQTKEIYKLHVFGVEHTQSTRVFVDISEILRKRKEEEKRRVESRTE